MPKSLFQSEPSLDKGKPRQSFAGLRPEEKKQRFVLAQLQEIWLDLFAVESVGIHDNFLVLGGHSLLAMRLAAEIQNRLGKTISIGTILENPTIREIADVLRRNHEPGGGSPIVEIQPKGSRPPLLLVHGAGGGMLWGYRNLARYLGEDQPVLAFKSQALDGCAEPESIQELAARYLSQLRKFQPFGPYYLGGYCFGGLVAYEMARTLEQAGQKTVLLALINTTVPNSSYSKFAWTPVSAIRFVANILRKSGYAIRSEHKQWRASLRWRSRWLRARTRGLIRSSEEQGTVDLERWTDVSRYSSQQRQLWQTHVRAWNAYQPQPFGGRVTLFRSTVHQLCCSFDETYGWRELAQGGVEIHVVASGHNLIMQEPYVKQLAAAVRAALDKAQYSPATREVA